MTPSDPLAGYLFAYFAGEAYEDGEQVYLALSRDGLNWIDMNHNQPVLYSTVGAQGVRDPFLLRSVKGNGFWMIATDERVYRDNDWKRAQNAASKSIVIWESADLVNWSEPRLVQVSYEDAGCTWAPEVTYNKKTEEYVLYWASTIADDYFQKQRIYCTRTTDFYSFTPPEIYLERDKHVIDLNMVEYDGVYYRYYRTDVENCIVSDCVNELMSGMSKRIPAPFLQSQQRVEGPFAFQFIGQQRWCLLIDAHTGAGYYPLITTDLASGEFTLPAEPYRMPTRARHGSVLAITEHEYSTLMNKWM
jgi:hypothetical protein